jgi:hypothetical protein
MSFTDDDLKRLKRYVKNGSVECISFEDVEALLARLEAAEAVCKASSEVVRPRERIGDAPRELKILNALEAWRKAAGK